MRIYLLKINIQTTMNIFHLHDIVPMDKAGEMHLGYMVLMGQQFS